MDIRYPIGKGELEGDITPQRREEWIKDIEDAPRLLRDAIDSLSDTQLDTPYREEGWTVRQIVHHLCDSNINSYLRFKLAITEEHPTIKTWDQTQWGGVIGWSYSSSRGFIGFTRCATCSLGNVS